MALDLAGIFPPIPTPFEKSGAVSSSGLRQNIRYLNRHRLKGIVALGSNGEFVFLTREEKLRTLEAVRSYLPSERLLIAGTGCEATRETIELTRSAASVGADAALVLNPHYYRSRMNREALIRHYTSIAEDSPIPIILYNMPAATALDLDSQTVTQLAEHPNIIGMKDSGGDLNKMARILGTVEGGFQVLAGSAGFLLPALSLGAVGGITALANLAPDLCIQLYEVFGRGELQKAAELQLRIVGLNNLVTREGSVPALKAALELMGLAGGEPRPPLLPADEDMRGRLHCALSELGLIG